MTHQRLKVTRFNTHDINETTSKGLIKRKSGEDLTIWTRKSGGFVRNVHRRKDILLLIFPTLLLLAILTLHVLNDKSLEFYLGWIWGHHMRQIEPFMQSEQILYDFVHTLRKPLFSTQSSSHMMMYDVNNCPENPPPNYPMEWPMIDILHNWNPDKTNFASQEQRPYIYQGICRFHYSTDMHKAMNYRLAEVPFILRDDPAILQVVYRWNQKGYLEHLLGEYNTLMDVEYSTSNQLIYFKDHRRNNPPGWKPPMTSIKMTYKQWLEKANQSSIEEMAPDKPHWYFRVNAKDEIGEHYLYHEMPFFAPSDVPNFYLVDLRDLRGINCRFGMMGNTAVTHFDASRNFIVILGGERRYIISHPRNCPYLALYPGRHPSGRHSKLHWSNPNLTEAPEFALAQGNEVVLQAGDVLYLPTYWFHYIVSLDLNWQCNARSGYTNEHEHVIQQCGF